jgi:hypothetical protein
MKRIAFVGAVLAAALAIAGNDSKETAGTAPATSLDGVSMVNAIGCRCTVVVPDAGSNTIGADGLAASGWRVVPWYSGPNVPWTESPSSLHCQPAARLDGGRIRSLVCPDYEPLASYGRMSCAKYGIVGYDGGVGADWLADGGYGPVPVFRTECFSR